MFQANLAKNILCKCARSRHLGPASAVFSQEIVKIHHETFNDGFLEFPLKIIDRCIWKGPGGSLAGKVLGPAARCGRFDVLTGVNLDRGMNEFLMLAKETPVIFRGLGLMRHNADDRLEFS